MTDNPFDYKTDNAWCPGCGNFGLRNILMKALVELNIEKKDLVLCSGIGQAAKTPQYLDVNYFNGLHGRSLPPATGIKAVNPNLTVIAESGDGDMYGEGGNHFLHAIRRNPDITVIIHNNMVYGLTKGQASPTTQYGMKTPIQVEGVFETPINPLALGIAMDASFVARGSVGEQELTKELIKKAIQHKGFAMVDIFQACVSFNKINTHKWFKENTAIMEGHDPSDRKAAFSKALEEKPWPLGVFYINDNKTSFEDNQRIYKESKKAVFERGISPEEIKKLIESKK